MFSLSLLFLTLPLYFSHVFMHFSVMMGDVSFERQKMYLFILVVLIALAEMILMRYDRFLTQMKRYGLAILGLISLPLIPIFLYGGDIDIYWIRGSYEKFHGYLLYVGIIILGFCISLLQIHEKKRLVTLSMIPATLVSIIALLEGIGVQVFFPPNIGAWGDGVRAISTLGNPNYLAGYLLILLPLTGYIRTPERYIVGLLILGALIMTGSYIGIGIGIMYGIYVFFGGVIEHQSKRFQGQLSNVIDIFKIKMQNLGAELAPLLGVKQSVLVITDEKSSNSRTLSYTLFGRFLTRNRDKRVRNDKTGNCFLPLVLTLIIGLVLIAVGYTLIPTDKLLSLSGRFVLMGEICSDMIRYPFVFLTGYGPEAILRFFSEVRSTIVDAYFPRGSIIDSSHNILIDFIFQYGIMPLIFLITIVYKNWNTWNPHARASWMLGITFLMFNPYVVMHLVLLTLTLSLHDNRR